MVPYWTQPGEILTQDLKPPGSIWCNSDVTSVFSRHSTKLLAVSHHVRSGNRYSAAILEVAISPWKSKIIYKASSFWFQVGFWWVCFFHPKSQGLLYLLLIHFYFLSMDSTLGELAASHIPVVLVASTPAPQRNSEAPRSLGGGGSQIWGKNVQVDR